MIEAEIRGKPQHERQLVRQKRARPLLDNFERWLHTMLEKLSRKSDTAAAIQYALNLWPALLRYCDDGTIEIDSSAAERALRGVAIGRRYYLCSPGADSGGEVIVQCRFARQQAHQPCLRAHRAQTADAHSTGRRHDRTEGRQTVKRPAQLRWTDLSAS